jgi:hypothetical protein
MAMEKKVYVVPESEAVYLRMEMNIMSEGDTSQSEGSEYGGNVFP